MGRSLGAKKRKKSSPRNTSKAKNTTPIKNSKVDSPKCTSPKKDEPNSTTQKKIRSFKDLVEAMKPSVEELNFRKGKSNEIDSQNSSNTFTCTKCKRNFNLKSEKEDKVKIHPCLGVLMCEKCCDYYGDGEFSLDSEGEDKYCRWCGEGGTIFGCSKCICGFCMTCIKKNFSLEYLRKVEEDDDWLCFFCNPKPLWQERYICSLAVEISENRDSSIAENGEKGSENHKKSSEVQNRSPESQKFSKNCLLQFSDSSAATDIDKSIYKSLQSPEGRRARKRLYSSSSDEAEIVSPDDKSKKVKLLSEEVEGSSDEKENFENLKQMVLERLERVLKLSEYQLAFGVNWSSKTLKKLADPKHIMTREGLLDECDKIKWFLSILSTYLVEFCNSVDSVEKSLLKHEPKDSDSSSQQPTDSTGFSAIMKFLSFITTQVNVFAKRGFSLQDVLEAEIYDDDKFIGIRKKLKHSNSNSSDEIINNTSDEVNKPDFGEDKKGENLEKIRGSPLNTRREKSKSDDNENQDEDSSPLVADEGSKVQEGGNENTDMNSSSATLAGTTSTMASDPKEDILQILEILEHA